MKSSKRNAHSKKAISTRWDKKLNKTTKVFKKILKYQSDPDFNFKKKKENDSLPLNIELEDIALFVEMARFEFNDRILSVIIYALLRYLGSKWRDIDTILNALGINNIKTSHKWVQILLSGDFDINFETRGGKRTDSFYDEYDDLEPLAKQFINEKCSQKSPEFIINDLVEFIDTTFYKIYDEEKSPKPVRSAASCRLDLIRWGASCAENSQRPYFLGHERSDVIAERNFFLNYFLSNKDNFYIFDGQKWIYPKDNKLILISHDESTFRSGEMRKRRWVINNMTTFFNKGRGKSVMVSDFIVQFPGCPFFRLNNYEWSNAVHKYPSLEQNSGIRFLDMSATAELLVGTEGYFDNDSILVQFERLFQMLQFKLDYKEHRIIVIVDQARTHSAKEYSINDFGMKKDTRCPVKSLEWVDDHGNKMTLDCFDKDGLSKGLKQIAKELNVTVPEKCLLEVLKSELIKHPAFGKRSKLEQLADKYKVQIIFSPKYHCELNPIEGLWCSQKK